MTLDTSGALLEGIRTSSGNNSFTYPPRDLITDQTVFSGVASRAEYALVASHPDSTVYGTDIGDPRLSFSWTRNEGTVVRFDYDSFNRRWNTLPGATPVSLGTFAQHLRITVPDQTVSSSSTSLYLGSPTRLVTFVIQLVETDGNFTNPPAGIAQVSKSSGTVNFGTSDLANPIYAGATAYTTGQLFIDRSKTNGLIGTLPGLGVTPNYEIFMNPIPGHGQFPRVRIGYQSYLTPIEVPTEADFSVPSNGTFQWSLDTGKIRLSFIDAVTSPSMGVYYDGVFTGNVQFARITLSVTNTYWPGAGYTVPYFIGLTDPQRYVLFYTTVDTNNVQTRSYLNVKLTDYTNPPSSSPPDGTVYINTVDGTVYLSQTDVSNIFDAVSFEFIDSYLKIENGVSVQIYRSGVNTSYINVEPDIVIRYKVIDQVISNGLLQVPFAMLPTVPLKNANLKYSIAPSSGSTGTFVGDLVDGNNPNELGFGYVLDLDNKRLSFTNRETISLTLAKSASQIKLAKPMINETGFLITKNGASIRPGVDFDFNSTSGFVEFIEPIGENDPMNELDILGNFVSPNLFKTVKSSFNSGMVGQFLLVASGPNTGIYLVTSIQSPHSIGVDIVQWPFIGPGTADIRVTNEVVVDRVWTDFVVPFKKFSVVKTNGTAPSKTLTVSEFSVLATTAQVNLNSPAQPGDVYQVTYTSLDSTDNGVTTTPTTHVEYAAFKIRQEVATTAYGTTKVLINSYGRTVDPSHPIKVYVDGVTQDDGTFTFTAPGTIALGAPVTTETVIVDYWVREAFGGETNFNLLNQSVDVDFPQILAGNVTTSFNSDQTALVSAGSAFLIDKKEVVIVKSVVYDSVSDTTTVTFEETPTISSETTSALQVSGYVSGSYRELETATADAFVKGTNTISINGQHSYPAGTIVTVNGDPYLVSVYKYDSVHNKTLLMTSGPAKFNYIIPKITRTIRPVFFNGSSFSVSQIVDTAYPFTLILQSSVNRVLVNGVDYQTDETGKIFLNFSLNFGDSLHALYVARNTQPAGTVFEINYAYGIAPDSDNGILGQSLLSSYDLYAPDTFFYRVETVQSFIPEVISSMKQSSSGGSGPNIGNATSLKTKDYGYPSLYFDEQHLGNYDVVMSRLLKFYNDLANGYEDILANLDGRVVGAESGRFRFDGNFDNPPRSQYSDITNDIDDKVLLYNDVMLSGFYTFIDIPVYGAMWESNNLSRIYPDQVNVSTALNSKVGPSNKGKVLGALGISNITSVGPFTSTRAVEKFASDPTGLILTVTENGNSDQMNPPFAVGQKVNLYDHTGVFSLASTVTYANGVGPYQIIITNPTTLPYGSIVQDTSDPTVSLNHFYTPGRDLAVNTNNGQIINISLPPPLDVNQTPIVGNELVDTDILYTNQSTVPRRIPVLDGLTENDDGHVGRPTSFYKNETDLLTAETFASAGFTKASVALNLGIANLVSITTGTVNVGDRIDFLDGPNAGQFSIVSVVGATVSGVTTCTVSSPFSVASGVQNVLQTIANTPTLFSILNDETAVTQSNTVVGPTGSSIIGTVNSELNSISQIMLSFGSWAVNSTGTVTSDTLTDNSIDFTSGSITLGSFIVVSDGPNIGLYKISSIDQHSISVITDPPYNGFASPGGVSYTIINPWSFLSRKGFDFVNPFIQSTLTWISQTQTWSTILSSAGVANRITQIQGRQSDITGFIKQVSGLLETDDKIYSSRYLWIDSRTNKKTGTLIQKSMAVSNREDATQKLLADQQRLLIAEKLN